MSITSVAARRGLRVAALVSLALVLYVAPSLSAAPAAVLIIDEFTTDQGPVAAVPGTPASSSASGGGMVGGERDMLVTALSGPAIANAKAAVSNSELRHNQDSGIIGQTLIQWDGVDGSQTLNPTGLGGVDFTQGNTQNGISLTSLLNDLPVDLTFTLYTDAGNASEATITLPGGQPTTAGPQVHYVPYAAFTTALGAGADFTDIGAVQLLIDGYNDSTDLTISVIRTAEFDWGDLPDSTVGGPNYATRFADDGPRHLVGALFLGEDIDPAEIDGIPTVAANGDDTSGIDDEDGVVRTPGVFWNAGADRGSIDVTVTGGPGCLSGWIDWNGNGVLTDANDNVLSNISVATGTNTHTFFVPVNPFNSTFYARFRLYPPDQGGGCTTPRLPTGEALGGEVEDYVWSFGPNAINLSSFSGTATATGALPAGAALLTAVGGLYLFLRRGFRS